MPLSDHILAANREILTGMLEHRFVTDIRNDRLSGAVFHRYLIYEGRFVETAISIFAYATARAPDMATRRWLISVLEALANTQVPYFEEVTARLALDTPQSVPADVTAFDQGMLALARDGSFLDIITAMFAAEWMYWTWCTAAASCQVTDPDLRRWVDLHADPEFAAQARWLRDTIDHFGEASDLDRLSAIFDRVMRLEVAFHTAAFEVPS